MVLAPKHDLVSSLTTSDQKATIDTYVSYVNSRSELERISEKKITGAFTGAHAINPFNGKRVPIWISEYVLKDYGDRSHYGCP